MKTAVYRRNQVLALVASMFKNELSITTTHEEMLRRFERLLNGMDRTQTDEKRDAQIAEMNNYHRDNFDVVLPRFVYEGAGKAAALKWYIIEYNKPLRKLKETLERDSSKQERVASMINLFQDYIDAVSSVLDGFYHVDVDLKSSQELFNEVDFRVKTDPEYKEYNKMFEKAEDILG